MTAATTPKVGIKQAALDIVQSLPDDATWGDLQYKLHEREKIERGLADIEAGRVVSHETVMAEFGLKPRTSSGLMKPVGICVRSMLSSPGTRKFKP